MKREMSASARSLIGGFEDRKRVTLRYTETVTLTSTSGALATYVFRGNGPYDPNQSGTGAQPNNWDDYALQYYNQHTLGSRIYIQGAINTNTNIGVRMVLSPRINSAAVSCDDSLSEPYAKGMTFNTYNTGNTLASAMSSMRRFGLTQQQLVGSDSHGSLTSAVPSDQWYWVIAMESSDKSTTVASNITVTVDYDILFHERLDQLLDVVGSAQHKVLVLERMSSKLRAFLKAQPKQPEVKGNDELSANPHRAQPSSNAKLNHEAKTREAWYTDKRDGELVFFCATCDEEIVHCQCRATPKHAVLDATLRPSSRLSLASAPPAQRLQPILSSTHPSTQSQLTSSVK
jgi:hypothetical protein